MTDTPVTSVELWSSAGFLDEVRAWVEEQARGHGLVPTGEWEQPHCRPWSSALRFETSGGRLWCKVNGPGTHHEAALVRTLGELTPGLVPEILAVDASRSWSLSRDAGPVMRSVAGPDELWSSWEGVLARYAEAQIGLADNVPSLLATGVRELSPATLPDRTAALLKTLRSTPVPEGGLTEAEAEAVDRRLVEYAAWCGALAESGGPGTIQHDDLHAAHVCWGGSVATARLIDWGDASVGHPLGTMLCTLNSVAYHSGRQIDDPRVLRVRDAYLAPFTSFAGRTELVEYVDLARRVGCVTRALCYEAALLDQPLSTHAEHDFPVRGWFLEMLDS